MFSVPNYLGLAQRMLSYAEARRIAAVYPVRGSDQLRVVLLSAHRSSSPTTGTTAPTKFA